MTIDPFQDDLKAYLDGELSWLRRLAIRRHLTHCASCQKEMKEMTQIADDLRTSEPAASLDPALREKILEIAEPTPKEPTPALRATPPETGREGVGREGKRPVRAFPDSFLDSSSPRFGGSTRAAGEGGYGSRKRSAMVGAIALLALIAWFAFFPVFQKVHENARLIAPAGDNQMPSVSEASPPAQTTAAQLPPPVQDANPLASLNERFEAPKAASKSGSVQTYDQNRPPVGFTPETLDTRQVHKEASIGVQVPNPETVSDTVEMMVKETGGYIASNTLNTDDGGLKTAELTVKVPVAQFETFMAQVAKLGNVQSKNISGEDITEKTSDADQTEGVLEDDVQQSEARLKALGAKAKWRDEQATRDLRMQLAQAQARLVLLKRLAALSTVTIDLSQTPPKPAPPAPIANDFGSGLKAQTHDALQSLLNSLSALIALAIWLLAYAPVWIPLLLIGRYALREYRKREAA